MVVLRFRERRGFRTALRHVQDHTHPFNPTDKMPIVPYLWKKNDELGDKSEAVKKFSETGPKRGP